MALNDPFLVFGALIALALVVYYVYWEVTRRGGWTLANLHAVISVSAYGRVAGLLFASESLASGFKVVWVLATADTLGPFDPSDWFFLLAGGAGAIWFGLAGIIEMFVLAAQADP